MNDHAEFYSHAITGDSSMLAGLLFPTAIDERPLPTEEELQLVLGQLAGAIENDVGEDIMVGSSEPVIVIRCSQPVSFQRCQMLLDGTPTRAFEVLIGSAVVLIWLKRGTGLEVQVEQAHG